MKRGFFQALGVALYCSLVGIFMWNAERLMPGKPSFLAPIAFLTLFCTSALICALIVFYKPYKLFFDGKKKEAIETVFWTAKFLTGFVVIFLLLAFTLK